MRRGWESGMGVVVKMQAGRAGRLKKNVCISAPGERNKATKDKLLN